MRILVLEMYYYKAKKAILLGKDIRSNVFLFTFIRDVLFIKLVLACRFKAYISYRSRIITKCEIVFIPVVLAQDHCILKVSIKQWLKYGAFCCITHWEKTQRQTRKK